MNTLDGWERVKLLDVAESINAGGTPRRNVKEYWHNGKIPWLKISDLKSAYINESEEKITQKGLENSSAKLFPKGTVLFSIFATIGASGILEKPSTTNQAIAGIVPDKRRVDTKFLYYLLKSEKNTITNKKTHATQDNINLTVIRNHEFLLPPLETQTKIVSILEKAEQLKHWRKEANQFAESYLISVFQKIFGNTIKNPYRWKTNRLEDLADRITKGESPKWQGYKYCSKGPMFIRSENVGWGYLDLKSRIRIPEEFHQKLLRSQLKPEDVLINLVGASIGMAAVLPHGIGEANVNQAVAVITPKSELESTYLLFLLLSSSVQNLLQKNKVESARANISLTNLRNLEIPIPPYQKQKQFSSIFHKIQLIKEKQKQSNFEIDKFFNALEKKAFTGELVC